MLPRPTSLHERRIKRAIIGRRRRVATIERCGSRRRRPSPRRGEAQAQAASVARYPPVAEPVRARFPRGDARSPASRAPSSPATDPGTETMTPLCRCRSALAVLALLVLGECVAVAAHRPPSGGAQVPEEHRFPPAFEDDDRRQEDDNGADGENVTATATTGHPRNTRHNRTHGDPLFPKDLFTPEQLRHGAVLFHIIGLVGTDDMRPLRLCNAKPVP